MGYIGNQQTEGFSSIPAKQDLTGATGTSLTLTHAVASAEGIDLFINNVRQESGEAYSIAGDGVTVTLTGSVVASDDIYVVYNSLALQTTVPPDGSVGTAKISDGSVTAAKLAAGAANVAGITTASTSGTAMSIDSSNRILTPARPAFSVYLNTGTGVGDNTSIADIPFDTKDFDIGTNVTVSNNAEFTAPVSGVYQFNLELELDNFTAAHWGSLYVYINDTAPSDNNLAYRALIDPTGGEYQHFSNSFLIQLTASQTVNPKFQVSGDTTTRVRSGTRFSGFLVG